MKCELTMNCLKLLTAIKLQEMILIGYAGSHVFFALKRDILGI